MCEQRGIMSRERETGVREQREVAFLSPHVDKRLRPNCHSSLKHTRHPPPSHIAISLKKLNIFAFLHPHFMQNVRKRDIATSTNPIFQENARENSNVRTTYQPCKKGIKKKLQDNKNPKFLTAISTIIFNQIKQEEIGIVIQKILSWH